MTIKSDAPTYQELWQRLHRVKHIGLANQFQWLIKNAIRNGEVTWEQLGATAEQLDQEHHLALVRAYRKKLHRFPSYKRTVGVRFSYFGILDAVKKGEVTWDELGTTPRCIFLLFWRTHKRLEKAEKKLMGTGTFIS